jgi:hypothetical protein
VITGHPSRDGHPPDASSPAPFREKRHAGFRRSVSALAIGIILSVGGCGGGAISAEILQNVYSMAPAVESSSSLPSALPLQRDTDTHSGGIGLFQLAISGVFLAICGAFLWRRQGRFRGAQPSSVARQWYQILQKAGWSRFISTSKPVGLRLVHSLFLTPRASVHVIQWDGREWLVGCTDGGLLELGARASSHGADLGTSAVTKVDA